MRRALLQVLLLLTLYFLSRLCFTLINQSHFEGLGKAGFLRLAFYGLRYDLSAICALNALYFFLLLLPLPTRWLSRLQRPLNIFFLVVNSLALLFEISDWAYFPYNFKRATSDVLRMVSRPGDFWNLLPSYLLSYWYVPLAALAFILALIRVNRRITRATTLRSPANLSEPIQKEGLPFFLGKSLVWLIVLGLCLVGIRGGLQYIPIGLRNAVQVTESRYVPVVLNTPFSIITTLFTPALEEVHYLPEATAQRLMPFQHQYSSRPFRARNVVFVILESESKEFTALGNGHSFTPFLDSLMGRSLTCTQAFANGQTSAEGIPAILAGIPTLMEEAFITSNYGANRISALPTLLREKGYSSAFYHGGTNGTMSFDVFAASAGFQHYYGRSEYGDENDYDGAWGIRDEPFLQYFAHGLSGMKPPFVASVFTLSSHPPYNLPEQYRKSLPAGPLPVQQCIAYTDLALRRFFATAAQQPWYDSTLFIITADHCSPQNGGGFYAQGLGRYAIPILVFCPSDTALHGYYDQPVQQIDILPSVLEYLGYDQPFFAYGNSLFGGDTGHWVITHNSGSYQWLEHGFLLRCEDMQPTGYFAYPQDSLDRQNLLGTSTAQTDSSLLRLKAFVQRYRESLLQNRMYLVPGR